MSIITPRTKEKSLTPYNPLNDLPLKDRRYYVDIPLVDRRYYCPLKTTGVESVIPIT